jgi:hypothetical protein
MVAVNAQTAMKRTRGTGIIVTSFNGGSLLLEVERRTHPSG